MITRRQFVRAFALAAAMPRLARATGPDPRFGPLQSDPDEILEAAARTNPLGRNATEADVSEAISFLLSDEAAFVTGVALDVDGGASLGFLPGT